MYISVEGVVGGDRIGDCRFIWSLMQPPWTWINEAVLKRAGSTVFSSWDENVQICNVEGRFVKVNPQI